MDSKYMTELIIRINLLITCLWRVPLWLWSRLCATSLQKDWESRSVWWRPGWRTLPIHTKIHCTRRYRQIWAGPRTWQCRLQSMSMGKGRGHCEMKWREEKQPSSKMCTSEIQPRYRPIICWWPKESRLGDYGQGHQINEFLLIT